MTRRFGDAGCLPITKDGRIVIISSKKNPGQFVFPKGGIHQGEDASVAAQRETVEEAGVSGTIIGNLGIINDCQWFILGAESVYGRWDEMYQRQRQLITIEDGLQRPDLRPKAREVLMAYIISLQADKKD